MLERLQIENFQVHDRLQIRLDPEVTAIVGPSDVGKSAVLRALRWAALNRPRGEGFVRHGARQCQVAVKLSDGRVRRTKGRENVYEVNEGEPLKAFGADVPEDVRSALKLTEVNFQGQHDPPFWFHLTAGEVARRLNEMVDLSLIDRAQSRVATRLRDLKARDRVVEERLNEASAAVDSLAHAVPMNSELKALERIDEERAGLAARHAALAEIVREVKEVGDRTASLREAARGCEKACLAFERWEDVNRSLAALRQLVAEIESARELSTAKVPDLSRLESLMDETATRRSKHDRLDLLLRAVDDQKAVAEEARRDAEAAEQQLHEEVEGRCPLCGSEVKSPSPS